MLWSLPQHFPSLPKSGFKQNKLSAVVIGKTSCRVRYLSRLSSPVHDFKILKYRRHPNKNQFPLQPAPRLLHSSISSYLLLVVICGSAALIGYIERDKLFPHPDIPDQENFNSIDLSDPFPVNSSSPFFTNMTNPPGQVGNLTADQEAKLRELWALTLKTFGVEDPSHPNGATVSYHDDSPAVSESDLKERRKSKKRISLFGKKHDDAHSGNGTASPTRDPSKHAGDDDDKYGQVKEFQHILATQSPESLRLAFWSMVKADHPDGLLLRFLRARKWDVDKALVMLISTMSWRASEIHVDDDIVKNGEGGALADSKSSDASIKREGEDFLAQLRLGKSFLHGTDKQGRPLCVVRARLHRGGDQTERALERYTVYVIETARLALRTPVETACIVFDMTHFTMANMDYTPVKFMIKVFEANYPESLGAVLVHKAPWIFQGIWKIIRGWLDPVVAGKVHFTSGVEDLEEFIPRSQIIKELGGEENWEYQYIEPVPGENDLMKEEAPRKKLEEERKVDVLKYQTKTFDWIAVGSAPEAEKIKSERNELAHMLNENYWQLDPYIRARTLYDRVGMIEKGGKINFYPSHKSAVANGSLVTDQNQSHADDVD